MATQSPPEARAAHADPATRERLRGQLADLARRLGEREQGERPALRAAWQRAEALHGLVGEALEAFHAAAAEAGLPELRVELSAPRADDKHLRSVQFDLRRGRHQGIVTVKSRGEVTLVGPFRAGKVEGPCKRFPFAAVDDIEKALGEFLESVLEQAATP